MSTQVASAMPPPAARPAAGLKRKREVTTLDEDEWTSRIEAIIQRDYYPDLPKLQNKLEWLQASRTTFAIHSSNYTVVLLHLFVKILTSITACYVSACQYTDCCRSSRCSQLSIKATKCIAGSQEWRFHANTASTTEHCTAACWNQDTCGSNTSCIWHAWCQPLENIRPGHSSFWNTSNDTWVAGHGRFVPYPVCNTLHVSCMCAGASLWCY